jgi:hypothetical protein
LLVAVALAAPVPAHLGRPPVYYFPTTVGTKLEYEEPGRQLTMIVTGVREQGGARVVSVGRVAPDDSVTPLMTMAVTGTGLYRLERGGRKLDTPEVWLQLPAEPGDAWDYSTGDLSIQPRAKVSSVVVGTEEVTVPAGTFRCVGVRCLVRDRSVTYWYAPDVGLVKTEAATWTEVLKSYTPGKR